MHQELAKYEDMMKKLSRQTFNPPKGNYCKSHKYQELLFVCGNDQCEHFLNLYCSECDHKRGHLLEFKRGTTILKASLQQKWDQIQESTRELSSLYLTCKTNIGYCQDILGQIEKQVDNYRQESYRLPIFQEILGSLIEINSSQKDYQGVAQKLVKLNSSYELFQKLGKDDQLGTKQNIKMTAIQKEVKHRQAKWTKIGSQIKKFSETMLAFINKLQLEFKQRRYLHEKEHKSNQKFINKLTQLSELMNQLQSKKSQAIIEKMQNLPSLIIEFSEKSQHSNKSKAQLKLQECQFLEQNLHKLKNLTSIVIKNKNGRIDGKMWQILTQKMEFLKYLKELWLNIRVQDMKLLTTLFKQRPNAVRSISILHLTITDEPKLEMKDVALFCNTLELRELYLVLSRDNIKKSNFIEFTKLLRFKTSLSNLPMDVLQANLSKNKITEPVEIAECTSVFLTQFKPVKKTQIIF